MANRPARTASGHDFLAKKVITPTPTPMTAAMKRITAVRNDKSAGLAVSAGAGLDTLALYIPPDLDPQQLETETLGLGIPYIPRPVAQAVVAVDHKIGRDMGRRLLAFVRQVYRYLHHDIGERIRAEVRTELHRPGPRLVIAHSLGSVIAFDMLTRDDTGPGPDGLTALVTCGSPLAWPTIRHSLGQDGSLQLNCPTASTGGTFTPPVTLLPRADWRP
ncbi:hypothetical protein [Streptomyces sp. P3]|uniref:hypothetical protein n=2 Tax=unclassified Streptomyces TaxID=2593676 RepID=UPI00131F08E0|nr:hypothetical protein [Streptomyces sp. P3]